MSDVSRYPELEWNDELVTRFWRWQEGRSNEYFTKNFGDQIARGLAMWLKGGDGTVLDYGCGIGFLPRHLAKLGCKVSATDFSPEAVRATNNRNVGVRGFEGAMVVEEMLGAGNRFSRVVSVEVIEHLSDKHIKSYFAAIRRLLQEDGLAIITTPNNENLVLSQVYCPCCEHVFHRFQHVRSFTSATLAKVVTENGLSPVVVLTTDFSRQNRWNPKQVGRDLIFRLLGISNPQPHLVCIAKVPT